MGNLARKLQQEQQERQAAKPKKIKKKVVIFSPGEKVLGFVFCLALCYGGVQIVANQASIYELNKEVQETSALIQNQYKVNADLSQQVEELSTYERILEKAKQLGLQFNENNVKVVQE